MDAELFKLLANWGGPGSVALVITGQDTSSNDIVKELFRLMFER